MDKLKQKVNNLILENFNLGSWLALSLILNVVLGISWIMLAISYLIKS